MPFAKLTALKDVLHTDAVYPNGVVIGPNDFNLDVIHVDEFVGLDGWVEP